MTPDPGTALDLASEPLAAVLAMCVQGRAALVRAASVAEAREILAQIATLERAIEVRDMNHDAVVAASTLRIRAERRVGELLRAQDLKAGRPRIVPDGNHSQTLTEQGISRKESATYQRLARPTPELFDAAVERVATRARKEQIAVTREAVHREIDPAAARTTADHFDDAAKFKSACDRVAALADAAANAITWGHYPGPAEPVDGLFASALLLSLQRARAALDRIETTLRRRIKK